MNLITTPWLPARSRSGEVRLIRPCDVVDPDLVDFACPVAELSIAAHEYMIGLLSTCVAPETDDSWAEWWDAPPTADHLQRQFMGVADAMNLLGDEHRFMQDADSMMPGRVLPIWALSLRAPGQKTLLDNTARVGDVTSPESLADIALALYAVQTQAMSGGSGHRANMRRGGGLITLPIAGDTLWRRIWLSVETTGQIASRAPAIANGPGAIFPWMAPTRVSTDDASTTTLDAHPLQAYWQMPRRIRLIDTDGRVESYRTLKHGVMYASDWRHPLSPYEGVGTDKQRAVVASGSVTCRDWSGLLYRSPSAKREPALAVTRAINDRARLVDLGTIRVAVVGYHANSAGIIEVVHAEQPVVCCATPDAAQAVEDAAARLVAAGDIVIKDLRAKIYACIGASSNDAGRALWSGVEGDMLALIMRARDGSYRLNEDGATWIAALGREARDIFDGLVDQNPASPHIETVLRARKALTMTIGGKNVKKALMMV